MTAGDVVKVIAGECCKRFDAQRNKTERLSADMKKLEEVRAKMDEYLYGSDA